MASPPVGGGLFPLPGVPPGSPSSSTSRRSQQRAARRRSTNEVLGELHRSLNCLSTSNFSLSHTSPVIPSSPSRLQQRAAAYLQCQAARYTSRLQASTQGGDAQCDYLFTTSSSPCDGVPVEYTIKNDAIPLCAERVALPTEGGVTDLLSVLPPEVASRYAGPSPELFQSAPLVGPAPAAFLVASPEDYVAFLTRLYSRSMVCFRKDVEVVNGLFALDKGDGMQRVIIDGRPVSARFAAPPSMNLTTPDALSHIEIPSGESVFVCKADVDNFYHRLRVPEWLQPFLALPPVRAGEVGLAEEFGADTWIYPCCTTLPMGFSHSCFLAQSAHDFIVETRTPLSLSDRITRTGDRTIDRIRYFLYIDDANFFAPGRLRAELDRVHAEYMAVMDSLGLQIKASKTVLSSADGVEVVGLEFHGRHGTLGAHPAKLSKLCRLTRALLHSGQCTGRQLSRIVGLWTWYALPRRPAFSVFSAVYRFIASAKRKPRQIWPSVEKELRVMMGLAPVLHASLRAPWFSYVLATDASTIGQGVVATAVSPEIVRAMALTPPPMVTPVMGGVLDRTLPESLVGLRWFTVVSSAWQFKSHINELELLAVLTGVRWVASFPSSVGVRMFVWCDSSVVVHAIRKGRSSAYRLLRRLRRLTAWLLALNITLHIHWIATEVNPSDKPSRECRRPRYEFDSTLGFPGEGPDSRRVRPLNSALVINSFAGRTYDRYIKAVRDFVTYARSEGLPLAVWQDLDCAVVEYFDNMYIDKEGRGRSQAESTLYGLHFLLPECKRATPFAQRALRGWKKLVPPNPHPPLTWELTCCVALQMAKVQGWEFGVACLLAFDSYLRVGELAGLKLKDVAVPNDARLGAAFTGVALRLGAERPTKTGSNQYVAVRNQVVAALLARLVAARRRRRRLFSFSAASFRRSFSDAVDALGLSPRYVPHSLRHGGATHDFLLGVSLEEILHRGRWASNRSARHYIQSGRALLLSMEVPSRLVAVARILAGNLLRAFTLLMSQ